MEYTNLSEKANNIINKFFKEKEIISKKEILGHDGFDQYGPKSNLWTLHIVVKEEGNLFLYKYYYEDWFSENFKDDYELLSKKKIDI